MQKTERRPVLHFSKTPDGSFSRANVPPVPNIHTEGVVLYPAKIDVALGTIPDIEDFGPRHPKAEITRLREIELGMVIKNVQQATRRELFDRRLDGQPLSDDKLKLLWNDLTPDTDAHLGPATEITDSVKNKLVLKVARQDPTFIQARNELVETHLGIVKGAAHQFKGRGKEVSHLEEVGYEELTRAAERYDWGFSYFGAFAFPTVKGRLLREFRDDEIIRTPRRIKDNRGRVQRIAQELAIELGAEPNLGQIAERTNAGVTKAGQVLSESEIQSILTTPSAMVPVSLDQQRSSLDDGTSTIGDTVADPLQDTEGLVTERVALYQAVGALPERERNIVHLYFWEGRTQADIATEVGLSQMQVSRRLTWATAALGKYLEHGIPKKKQVTNENVIYIEPRNNSEFMAKSKEAQWYETINSVSYAEAVRLLRVAMNLTRQEFSIISEVPNGTLEHIEYGRGATFLKQINKIIHASVLADDGKAAQLLRLKSQGMEPMTVEKLREARTGDFIKYIRIVKGITQEELAGIFDVSTRAIKFAEASTNKPRDIINKMNAWLQPDDALQKVIEQKMSGDGIVDSEILQSVAKESLLFIDPTKQRPVPENKMVTNLVSNIDGAATIREAFEMLVGLNGLTKKQLQLLLTDIFINNENIVTGNNEILPLVFQATERLGYTIHDLVPQALLRNAARHNKVSEIRKRVDIRTRIGRKTHDIIAA